ncbi:MAG: flagellar motor switch protein FliG [Salinisphaeraceae bacterium]|nr:flagellar motor switch protein FliG [Salinisphaeraceae bacterium]
MAELAPKVSGTQKAAILLMSLGESEAAQVLQHMGAKDVQRLGQAMASVSEVTKQQAETVMDDFVSAMENQTSLGVGADDYVRKVLVEALGEDKAGGMIDRILQGHNTKGLEALKWMEPRSIAELIRNEHPQIIAIVLSYLDSDLAAEVLGQLPDRVRPDVMMRIATLDGIPPSALHELDDIMERQFAGQNNLKSSSVGGVKVAANIMNFLESSREQEIMAGISENDEALATQIHDLMFVFDNLAEVEDRDLQTLLRDVPNDQLALALKGAEPKVAEKIKKNMSQRAAEILADDMEALGPVRVADVEAAQKEILVIARSMADEGTISLVAQKGDEYV